MSTYWDPYQREKEDRARRAADAADAAFIHGIALAIYFALGAAIGHLLALAIRHGYGKHILFLVFVAPVLLFVVALVVGLVLGVHAHPQAFLAYWQAYVIRHPGAASWTWLVRGFTELCRW
ncbi:hypothetical protein [Acidithiobacillus ferridurans]|uniref:hypothetical protein n=1 Tax=Acidithiobacillus ferridurans TaxID=1232575 RepID=UPI001D025A9D|nr:hypothetical protein [Acidithiobacillus ferridurans]